MPATCKRFLPALIVTLFVSTFSWTMLVGPFAIKVRADVASQTTPAPVATPTLAAPTPTPVPPTPVPTPTPTVPPAAGSGSNVVPTFLAIIFTGLVLAVAIPLLRARIRRRKL